MASRCATPTPLPDLWRQEFYLVDMPGYGFALAGEKDVARWQALYQHDLTLTLTLTPTLTPAPTLTLILTLTLTPALTLTRRSASTICRSARRLSSSSCW